MPTAIVDLDELLGADKQVRLGGKVYTLPSDLPVELYLRINNASKQGLSESEMVETLYGELLKLFQYGDAKITELPIGMSQLVQVIPVIYGGGATAEPEGDERPTIAKTRGASGAKSQRRSTRSRS